MHILVADNNDYTRYDLLQILKTLSLPISSVSEVSNGVEAIALLEQCDDIDLVITETSMPKLGGMEIAKYLLKQNRQIPVIVLTKSNLFSDVKEAIQYHVKSYLTKPVQPTELQEAILQIIQEKQKNFQIFDQEEQRIIRDISRSLSFPEILEGSQLRPRILGRVDSLCASWEYRICVLQTDRELKPFETEEVEKLLFLQAPDSLKQTFYFEKQDEYVAILFGGRETLEKPEITDLIHSNLNKIRHRFQCNVSAGLSKVHFGAEKLRSAYDEALYILSQRLLQGWNALYTFDMIRCHYHILTQEKELDFQSALKKADYLSAQSIITALLHSPELISHGNIYSLYDFTISLLKIINHVYLSLGSTSPALEEAMLSMISGKCDFHQYHHLHQLEEQLLGLTRQLCGFHGQKLEHRNYDIVQEILDYIENNYQYDISLQDLAVHKYFVNPSHLSRLFKSVVGQTFSKYLISVRIQKAKYLLENSNLKINDITMNVGYNDSSHFVQAFKKFYGITPKEYRSNFEKAVKVG